MTLKIFLLILSIGALFSLAKPIKATVDAPCLQDAQCNVGLSRQPYTCVGVIRVLVEPQPGKCVCPWGKFEQPLPGFPPDVCAFVASETPLLTFANKIALFVTGTVIALGLVSIAIGGYIYMTAGGSGERVGYAKTIIISALIGIVLALSAFAILNLVSTQFASEVVEPPELQTR